MFTKILFRISASLIVLLISGTLTAYTQHHNVLNKVQFEDNSGSKVRIVQSETLDLLVQLHVREASKIKKIDGYRIRIYRGSGATALRELQEVKTHFLRRLDDIELYEGFDYPDYLLSAGDFRTFSAALKYLKEIEKEYPNKLYIIPAKINYPKL